MSNIPVTERLATLERQIQQQRMIMLVLGTVALSAVLMPVAAAQPPVTDSIRTRHLVIEDVQGRPRIVMGAPLPASGGLPRSGIRINDPDGSERLGLNLFEDGRILIGLDAPRGAGDDRNRERITLIADATGGSTINFKDRRTSVVGRIYLDSANQLWMEFNDYLATPSVSRRIGIRGDQPPTP